MDRRTFNKTLLAGASSLLVAPSIVGRALADDEIKIASLFDLSGGLDIYGKPSNMCLQMAVEEINAAGGLLGKRINVVTFDAQSNMQTYAQLAQQAALKEKVALVHGTTTSASREVARPILRRYKTPLMYSVQYEGGVCDANTFCTGSTPTMQITSSLKWAVEKWGKKYLFMGADYNAPRITADWVKRFARDLGAENLGNEFFPFDVTEFGPVITKIQQLKPDFIITEMVGAAHVSFYRQWASAGLLGKIPQLSYTFGVGNEHQMLPATDTDGIVAAYTYFQELDTPANKDFVARYRKRYGDDAPYLNCLSIGGYEGTMIWAEAVRKAGSTEQPELLKAWQTGVVYEGPAGKMTTDGRTNHVRRDIVLGEMKNKAWTVIKSFPDQAPIDDDGQCDLVKSPETNQQFTPKV